MTATQIGQLLSPPLPGQPQPADDPNPRQSTAPQSGLLDAVDAIFEQLAHHYGAARMAAQWGGLDPEKAKRYWARKLAYMPRRNIGYGLRYLPDQPPSAEQFAAICRRCPPPPVTGLIAHKPTPEQLERSRAKIAEMRAKFPKFWRSADEDSQEAA